VGTREPTIQRQGADRILIQVPGIGSASELKALIGTTAQLTFNDLELPADALLGKEGQRYSIALGNQDGGRSGIAAQCVGMAQAAHEVACAYARERTSFGEPLMTYQAVSFRLANMATQIEAARQLVWHAARLKDAGLPCLREAAMAKIFASEMAEKVCSDALQTLGGYGYLNDFPLEQIARDVRVTKIYEGTSDIQNLIIVRSIEERGA
jgi:alkylation response protein AidB-like acyl-CoA dehydrogenase